MSKKNKQYKICYVVTIGLSIRTFFIPQLKMLSQNGFEVSVICSPDDGLKEMLGNDIYYYPVEIPRGISIIGMISAYKQIFQIIKKNKFDLVQYSTPNAALVTSIASRIGKVKIRNYHLMGLRYMGENGLKRKILKILEYYTCSLSTHIECVSPSNLDMAVKEKLFDREKAVVVLKGSSGGVDINRFAISRREEYRKGIRELYGLTEDDFVFGFVGRMTKDKGINELLSAFKKIRNSKLLMVGFLDEIDTLDEGLYEQSLNDQNIIYTGPVKEVEKYYAAIDCVILPSYREGFGNVIIEAAAMGTPAIVSNIPGPIDTSIQNETALWVPSHDEIALFQAMENIKILDYKGMGLEAAKYVTSSFEQTKLNTYILQRKLDLLSK